MSPSGRGASDARTPITQDELKDILAVKVYDRDGATHQLGELVRGKRSALIFIRHFWCLNCQAYVRSISRSISPSNLPPDTQILIIGCGSHPAIPTYQSTTTSAYPIYTDPSLQLHKLLRFNSNLSEGKGSDTKRDYMEDMGGGMSRIWGGLKGALGNLGDVGNVGPKSQNGGEVVLSQDGKCEYIYRMQNTVDHTNVSELAEILGAKYTPEKGGEETGQVCAEACASGGKGA